MHRGDQRRRTFTESSTHARIDQIAHTAPDPPRNCVVLRNGGCRIPEDVAVVGFDDIALSDIVYPPLTTIRLPRHELAEVFFKALDAFRNDSHAAGSQYFVRTSLVIRESTGPVRQHK